MSSLKSIVLVIVINLLIQMTPATTLFSCRCGSTLLETMLDSHNQIWGMGENSFFNANLTLFRNELVQAGQSNQGKYGFPVKAMSNYSLSLFSLPPTQCTSYDSLYN